MPLRTRCSASVCPESVSAGMVDQVQAAEMEALQGGVLKGRSPQEVVAEVRALFTENGELRREAQKAKALAAENQALQQKLASLQVCTAAKSCMCCGFPAFQLVFIGRCYSNLRDLILSWGVGLQQSRPASTQSTPSASPAQIPSVGPTTPEPQVLGKSGVSSAPLVNVPTSWCMVQSLLCWF